MGERWGSAGGDTCQHTYVLWGEEEAFPVELLVFRLFGRAVGLLRLRLLLLLGFHHARHFNVAVLLAEPHCGRGMWVALSSGKDFWRVKGPDGGWEMGEGAKASWGEARGAGEFVSGAEPLFLVSKKEIPGNGQFVGKRGVGVGGRRGERCRGGAMLVVVVVARRRIGEKDHVSRARA